MKDYTKKVDHLGATSSARASEYDEGLRAYMLQVYNYMSVALALTGLVAFFGANSEAVMHSLYRIDNGYIVGMSGLGWIVALAPLGFIFGLSAGINRMKTQTAQMVFWAFSAVMGLSLTSLFMTYTGVSVARVFFITATVFGAMSLWGYTTKKDLTGWGSFLIMGLIGIIIASVVNMFLMSSALHFAVSILGVLIFVGLTAYDTQNIKNTYYQLSSDQLGKASILGALRLYLDFINLFIMLLRLFGERR
jgi:hypothetical protein